MLKISAPSNNPSVFIIVLNWNGLSDTVECIESLLGLKYSNYRIVIVDNASEDNSASVLKYSFPNVKIIQNEDNLGFSGGNNVGIRYALQEGAEYIWLLNNDTIVDEYSLASLIRVGDQDFSIGIIGSKILCYPEVDIIWCTWSKLSWKEGRATHVGMGERDLGQYDYVKNTDRVAGCSMLIKANLFNSIDMLDEKLFLFGEEVDLSFRAKKKGFSTVYVPESIVYHKESVSVRKMGNKSNLYNYYSTRNFLYLAKKLLKFPKKQIVLFFLILNTIKYSKNDIVWFILNRERIEIKSNPKLIAVVDFLIGKMGKL